MKIKKQFIVLIVLLILITLIFVFVKNNKEIVIVNNKNYKDYYEFVKDAYCDERYANYDIDTNGLVGISNKTSEIEKGYGQYFHIIKTNEENAFLVDGCKWSVDAFLYEYEKMMGGESKAKLACKILKQTAEYDLQQNNMENNMDAANRYNESICVKGKTFEYRGKSINRASYGLETIEIDNSCDQSDFQSAKVVFTSADGKYKIIDARETKLPGLDNNKQLVEGYDGFAFLENGCPTGIETFFNLYTDKTSACSSMKDFVTAEESIKSNMYYYNYWVNYYNGICPDDKLVEKKEIDCSTRQTIIDNNNIEQAKKYNNVCKNETGFSEIKFSKIIMDWNDGWGPQNLDWSRWGGEYGTYQTEGIVGNKITVTFDAPLKDSSYLYHFVGWDDNYTCSNFPNSEHLPNKGYTGSIHEFTFEETDKTYYACYNGDIENVVLFDGNIAKSGVEYSVMEQNTCTSASTSAEYINQFPMKTLNKYIRREYKPLDLEVNVNASKDPDEQEYYCNVMCTDEVEVYYPNIFETVPAGQYFELMYDPEITATRTCQTEFRFIPWNKEYNDALTEEKDALVALSKAQAYYDIAKKIDYDSSECCGCCGEPGCEGGSGTVYSGTDYATYLDLGNNQQTVSLSLSASTCADQTWGEERSNLVNGYTDDRGRKTIGYKEKLAEAEQAYRDAVQHRINLEKINLQCFSVLDSNTNNNTEIQYTTVVGDNNTYKYKNNSPVINDSFKYLTKTQLINLDEDNYGTQKSNYLNYILKETSPDVSSIAQITENEMNLSDTIPPTNYQKETKKFYYLKPQITFSYNNGDSFDLKDNDNVNISETLQIEPHVKLDTGSYTDETNGVYTKNREFQEYGNNGSGFWIEYSEKNRKICQERDDLSRCKVNNRQNTKIIFKGYKAQRTYRTVKYYFTFHEATEYFNEVQSGLVSTNKVNDKYTSLSKELYINPNILQSHVFPVALNAVNNNNYKIEFKLTDADDTDYLKAFTDNLTGKRFTGNYTCSYEITNDALTLKNETLKNYKDLKSNTIFRSISPKNIDPNDRASKGNLGENWLNDKGKKVQSIIKLKESDDNKTKNTYNPANLEYSFTLTPSLINAIKTYNDDPNVTYDDFNLTCATEDNRECISDFLTDLSEGKVKNTIILPNYSSINNWNYDNLEQIRKNWKYFTGEDIEILEQTTKRSLDGTILSKPQAMSLVEYQNLYEKWGVLP